MLKFEAKRIDPTPEQVAELLSSVAGLTNAGQPGRFVADDPTEWRKFAKRAARRPEGWELWRGGRIPRSSPSATFVTGAWWTDPLGRRHFAARGWRAGYGVEEYFQKKELDRRPSLWHVYPDRCCLRHDRTGTQVVCVCACGVVGTPAALGWMGECCGPCFDRREEVGPGGLRQGIPGVVRGDGPLSAVACSPDGNLVGADGEGIATRVWNLMSDQPPAPAEAVDAVAHAVENRNRVPLAEPGLALEIAGGWSAGGWSDRVVRLVRPSVPHIIRTLPLPMPTFDRLAVSPDETLAAVASDHAVVIDLRSWAIVGSVNPPAGGSGGLAFSSDGSRLFVGGGLDLLAYATNTLKRIGHGSVREAFGPAARKMEWLRGIIVDPAGEAIYVAGDTGRVYVFYPRTLALRATFDWHLGAVTGLAISADGSRLFTAGADGCVKVWPIRDLLCGV